MVSLIKKLSAGKIRGVDIKRNAVSVAFLGKRISCSIKKRHVKDVANWGRRSNFIYVSKYLEKESIVPVLVHECVEKYVTKAYGLHADKEAHKVANAVERKFVISQKKNWRSHQQKISFVWRKENKRKIGRAKFY